MAEESDRQKYSCCKVVVEFNFVLTTIKRSRPEGSVLAVQIKPLFLNLLICVNILLGYIASYGYKESSETQCASRMRAAALFTAKPLCRNSILIEKPRKKSCKKVF